MNAPEPHVLVAKTFYSDGPALGLACRGCDFRRTLDVVSIDAATLLWEQDEHRAEVAR